MKHILLNDDMLKALDQLPENSIDSIITDPPYELGFMGNKWDNTGITFSVDTWKKCLRVLKPGGHLLAFNHSRMVHRMTVAIEDAGFELRDTILWVYGSGFPKSQNIGKSTNLEQWQGWGSALKPAYEPIIMARKPLEGTIAANILKWGTGAINIDESRVGEGKAKRFPANFIHDGSDEVVELFPETKKGSDKPRNRKTVGSFGMPNDTSTEYADEGSAARFFYVPKASKKDKEDGNEHPTVKPTQLMKYLARMVTPANGTILDPFMGSGSTGKAVVQLNAEENKNYKFIGIELNKEYYDIAAKRIGDDK
jgi:site-specific DNA-methyltransferase (adenine-specific)